MRLDDFGRIRALPDKRSLHGGRGREDHQAHGNGDGTGSSNGGRSDPTIGHCRRGIVVAVLCGGVGVVALDVLRRTAPARRRPPLRALVERFTCCLQRPLRHRELFGEGFGVIQHRLAGLEVVFRLPRQEAFEGLVVFADFRFYGLGVRRYRILRYKCLQGQANLGASLETCWGEHCHGFHERVRCLRTYGGKGALDDDQNDDASRTERHDCGLKAIVDGQWALGERA
mmetsp:Transcript_31490/g.92187  ORF Transcript_31490/g.92187 Transcript_31490/m.92187 type:complete len:228 (+) Transcript_31490:381-1064(+)